MKTRIDSTVELLECRTFLSAAAGSAYAGFGNAGVLAGYEVLAAESNGSLIASVGNTSKLVVLHPDGTFASNYSGPRPLTIPHQNVQSDGKYLVVKNGVLTRYNANGTVDKTFGSNGSRSNFYVPQSHLGAGGKLVYAADEVVVDGTQIYATGSITAQDESHAVYQFVEEITPNGTINKAFGNNGVAVSQGITYDNACFNEIGPDHAVYVAFVNDDEAAVARFSESGVFQGMVSGGSNTDYPSVNGIAFQPDGKILVLMDQANYAATLVRYNANLTVDPTFGGPYGVDAAPPGVSSITAETPTALVLRNDGTIFISATFQGDSYSYDSFAFNPGVPANSSSISGHFYDDVNANGKLDTGEPPLRYWAAYVDLNNVGYYQPGDPLAYADYNGYYKIYGLPAGTYTVREVKQTGWTLTEPGVSAGGVYNVTLGSNSLVGLRDFGNHFVASGVSLGTSRRYVQVSSTTGDDINHPHPDPTFTQAAIANKAFYGDLNYSNTVKYPESGFYDTITVSGAATQKSTVTNTNLTASGAVSAFENDNYATGPSFGKGETFFEQTFTVTGGVDYSLSASASALIPSFPGVYATFSFIGPNGAVVPAQSITQIDQPPISVNTTGVLAPGTYTIKLDIVALDDNNNGPGGNFSLNLKM